MWVKFKEFVNRKVIKIKIDSQDGVNINIDGYGIVFLILIGFLLGYN